MLIQRSSCGLKIPPQEVLAFRKFYRKEVLAVLTSNRKEVLAACRIQAQATRKKPQEVAGLRTQKEVLARALFLGCTVRQHNGDHMFHSTFSNNTYCVWMVQHSLYNAHKIILELLQFTLWGRFLHALWELTVTQILNCGDLENNSYVMGTFILFLLVNIFRIITMASV